MKQKTGLPSLSTSDKSAVRSRISPADADSIKILSQAQAKIVPVLLCGEENAISASVLASRLGLTGRELRARVRADRDLGFLILSSPAGYFLPSEDAERARGEILRCYRAHASRVYGGIPFLKRMVERLGISPQQIGLSEYEQTQ